MPPETNDRKETSILITQPSERLLGGAMLPYWSLVIPIAGLLAIGLGLPALEWGGSAAAATIMIGCVLAAVHQAEVVAHRVGEPFGTLVLAIAVTVIEVSLIVSLMISGGGEVATLARDTVFAAIMIILNGIVGVCLLSGGVRHHEQQFVLQGVNAALCVLSAMAVLVLVLPNFTSSVPGPVYSPSQLAFTAIVSLILYCTFVLIQTVRHRDYFLPAGAEHLPEEVHAAPPGNVQAWLAFALLVVALVGVVLLAKQLSPTLEAAVLGAGLPLTLVGIMIAALVLGPESLAAVKAARRNRLQTSLNLALGSALATIGLTIPTVAVLSIVMDWKLSLGIDAKSMTLLGLSLIVSALSLGTGRTTILPGMVHIVIFLAYLFTTIVP